MLNGNKIVVSTYNTGHLYIIKEDSGSLVVESKIRVGKRPMGMALSSNREHFAVGLLDRIKFFKFNGSEFEENASIKTGRINIHEIAFNDDGELLLNNTSASNIEITTIKGRTPQVTFRPKWITEAEGRDKCHLNGLALVGGQLKYATSFNQGDTTQSWQNKSRVTSGIIVDTQTNEIVCDDLSMPHSPMWHNDELWFCDSGKGQLCKMVDGKKEIVFQHEVMTRGLGFTETHAIVGLSVRRKSQDISSEPLMPVWARGGDNCGVDIINKSTGKKEAFVTLGKSGLRNVPQEIFDVLVVPSNFTLKE